MATLLLRVLVLLALTDCSHSANAEPPPMKVFVLAGQSNMAGPAVVDLKGKDYNDGRGTLVSLFNDPGKAPLVAHLRHADGTWRIRNDVFVRYTPEDKAAVVGPLDFGFTPQLDKHHFGPELQFGHVMGEALNEPVLLVKTAWGGKSLYKDFRPPSSGGEAGPYYRRMIDDVRAAIARAAEEIPEAKGRRLEIAGFVWYHGWNDGCAPDVAVPEYEQNLINLINDVRRDFGVADLPVVVGEITGPWIEAKGEWKALRDAQRAAATREEWKGRVLFVPTAAFVRKPDESPHPTHAHHEFGNAETYILVGDSLGRAMRSLVRKDSPAFVPTWPDARGELQNGELSGYMLVPLERAPKEFNSGFSLYAAAWPLVDNYPGSRFQTGLFGTWMFAQHEGEAPKNLYSDIEGGLGWWRDTRFATTTPKFIMGGVAPNFSSWANGPGAGKGRDWDKPLGKYAVAQLSPWVVWPPDGLNLAQGTCGELFGYGYLPLPLIDSKSTTAGAPVPTGDQCWTLFLNTTNFKGPLCFFTPYFWSAAAVEKPELAGLLLDSRPSEPNKAFQMETQWVPAKTSTLKIAGGSQQTYARTAPVSFPVDADGRTVVLHRLTTYTREALTEPVRRWFAEGAQADGVINPDESHVQNFGKGGGSTWRIAADGTRDDARRDVLWSAFGAPTVHDPLTFGYQWNQSLVRRVEAEGKRRAILPEYFRKQEENGQPPRWLAVAPTEVPIDTGLHDLRFETPKESGEGAYVTPDAPESPFRSPGPVAGPFEVTLGDGSTVTYAWYRFADQPAMLNADLTAAEREVVQRRVEMMHRAWTIDKTYLAPPTTGTLASLDPALLVKPPPGLEIGHVPIALRQERRQSK